MRCYIEIGDLELILILIQMRYRTSKIELFEMITRANTPLWDGDGGEAISFLSEISSFS